MFYYLFLGLFFLIFKSLASAPGTHSLLSTLSVGPHAFSDLPVPVGGESWADLCLPGTEAVSLCCDI